MDCTIVHVDGTPAQSRGPPVGRIDSAGARSWGGTTQGGCSGHLWIGCPLVPSRAIRYLCDVNNLIDIGDSI